MSWDALFIGIVIASAFMIGQWIGKQRVLTSPRQLFAYPLSLLAAATVGEDLRAYEIPNLAQFVIVFATGFVVMWVGLWALDR